MEWNGSMQNMSTNLRKTPQDINHQELQDHDAR